MLYRNPRYKHFKQNFMTAGDADQFDTMVDLKHYKTCVEDTFNYIFHKFKKGVFVHIKDNKIHKFVPFCKANFVNEFSGTLQVDPEEWNSFDDMFDNIKSETGRLNHSVLDIDTQTKYGWFANNGLIRYEKPKIEVDAGIDYVYKLIESCTSKYMVSDCTFFINKRDFPILKKDYTEPYDCIFPSTPLISHRANDYATILSMTTTLDSHDVAIPTWDDFNRENEKTDNYCSTRWASKTSRAVFRGSSTGLGTTLKNNVRLKLMELGLKNPTLLDVGITKWNLRPRRIKGDEYYRTIKKSIVDKYGTANFLSYAEQSYYKYVINVPGHSSSFRLGSLFKMKSVVLHVAPEYKIWYDHLLKPYIHYVPVRTDLRDLVKQIQWCEKNPTVCLHIVENAYKFYLEHLTIAKQCKFLYDTLKEVDNHYLAHPTVDSRYDWVKSKCKVKVDMDKVVDCMKISNICKNKKFMRSDDNLTLYKEQVNERDNIEVYNYKHHLKCLKNSYVTGGGEECGGLREIHGICDIGGKTFTSMKMIVNHVSLYDYLFDCRNGDINVVVDCMQQLCVLLNHAYSVTQFVHNDCTPWNVLLNIDYHQPTTAYIQNGEDEYVFNTCCTVYLIDYEKSKSSACANECRDMFSLVTHVLFLILTNLHNWPQPVINACTGLFTEMYPYSECKNLKEIVDTLSLFKKYDNMTSVNLDSINKDIKLCDPMEMLKLVNKHFQLCNFSHRKIHSNIDKLLSQYNNSTHSIQ